jgi:hypothetical protein
MFISRDRTHREARLFGLDGNLIYTCEGIAVPPDMGGQPQPRCSDGQRIGIATNTFNCVPHVNRSKAFSNSASSGRLFQAHVLGKWSCRSYNATEVSDQIQGKHHPAHPAKNAPNSTDLRRGHNDQGWHCNNNKVQVTSSTFTLHTVVEERTDMKPRATTVTVSCRSIDPSNPTAEHFDHFSPVYSCHEVHFE